MLHSILGRVARRRTACRGAHEWTDRALPPACIHCGRSQVS